MARGRGGHKGGRRHFTNPAEISAQKEKEEKERAWRARRGEVSDSEEEDEDGEAKSNASSANESEEESEDENAAAPKAKGVESLIEIENPNRLPKKAPKDLAVVTKVELSRREREELQKQRDRETYAKFHAQGKTEQARADLARLAIIKQQREEAQKKRDEEKRLKDDAKKLAGASKMAAVKSVSSEVTAGGSKLGRK